MNVLGVVEQLLIVRLREKFPDTPRDDVARGVTEVHRELDGNPIRDYVPVLVEQGRLRPGGFTFLTLGERRVDGANVPLVAFTQEILESAGHTHVASIRRLLPTRKRMAVRNTAGRTMLEETILVMQKDEL